MGRRPVHDFMTRDGEGRLTPWEVPGWLAEVVRGSEHLTGHAMPYVLIWRPITEVYHDA